MRVWLCMERNCGRVWMQSWSNARTKKFKKELKICLWETDERCISVNVCLVSLLVVLIQIFLSTLQNWRYFAWMRESKVIELQKENINDHLNFTYFNNRICTLWLRFILIWKLAIYELITYGEGVGVNMCTYSDSFSTCKLNQNRQRDIWVSYFFFLNHFLNNF